MALSSLLAASATISSSPSSLIISLLETVGIQVSICYLQPSDLFSLSLTSHQLHDIILHTNTLIQTCIQHHLPIQLGVSTNYLAELRESYSHNISYRSKTELVTHVLDQLHSSQLLLLETNTVQESEERAKKLFINQGKSSVMCYAADDTRRRATTTVECHFQSNATNESATAWIDYILNRDACKRYGQDRARNKLIRDWLMFILSSLQRTTTNNRNNNNHHHHHGNNSNIQIWRWGCKHSNLSGKGVSGVGVMISSSFSSSCSVDDSELQQLELELRLTRLY